MTSTGSRKGRGKRVRRDIARETAILEAGQGVTDDATGVPALDAVLSDEFVTGGDRQALEKALALQQYLRGEDASVLGRMAQNLERMTETMAKLNERMDKYDEAAKRWEENQQKYIEEVLAKSESLLVKGPAKEKLVAQAATEMQQKIQAARAEVASDRLVFEQQLKTMKKVQFSVAGDMVMTREGPRLLPVVISIKHKRWVLEPGKIYKLPKIVADEYHRRQRDLAHNQKLKGLLSATNIRKDVELASEWSKLEREAGEARRMDYEDFPGGTFPIASNA